MNLETGGTVTTGWIPLGGTHAGQSASVTEIVPTVVTGSVVVICEPYGMEGLSADNALNALAKMLVSNGNPVVRFRPPNLGDASDLAPEDSILGTWIASVNAAIELGTSLAGDHGVYLFGLRLGATLAGIVSETRSDISGLVLWAPVNGRLFLREQRLIRSSATRHSGSPDAEIGCVEAAGFRMSAASIAALESLDLVNLTQSPAPRMLVIDRDDVPSIRPLAQHLESLRRNDNTASSVTTEHWPGYSGLRLDTPDEGSIPTATFDSIIEWLHTAAQDGVAASRQDLATRKQLQPNLLLKNRVTERVARIGCDSEQVLHAIVTEPPPESADRALPIMVMLSTGGNPCSGAGRVHAELARCWAIQGFTSLRIDRRGVGITALGSHLAPNRHDEHAFDRLGPYADEHLIDLVEIEKFVGSEFGGRPYVLIGICSGGYAAFHSVRVGVHPKAIVSINQIIFDPLEFATGIESPIFAMKARYQLTKTLKSPSAWVPILRGDVPIRPAVRRLVSYARLRHEANPPDGNRSANPLDVNHQMQQMANLGVKQVYLLDEAETGLAYLRFRAGATTNELSAAGLLRISTISGAGHTFGTANSRAWLAEAALTKLRDLSVI